MYILTQEEFDALMTKTEQHVRRVEVLTDKLT